MQDQIRFLLDIKLKIIIDSKNGVGRISLNENPAKFIVYKI